MEEHMRTPLDAAVIVAKALDVYIEQHPLLAEEIEKIQCAASVARIRIQLRTGEAVVIDITREPRTRTA